MSEQELGMRDVLEVVIYIGVFLFVCLPMYAEIKNSKGR